MADFYERHPYPPPRDDLETYRRIWDDTARRRAVSHLVWPTEPYRNDRTILIAGCGTVQAAHYAVRWPRANVVGIDVSAASVEFTRELKRRYVLDNLEVQQLEVERVAELGRTFEYIVCTGVLHHLIDPDAGLSALRQVLVPGGALHVMVYAPYGRAGIAMLQEYCRLLGISATDSEIRALAAALKALPHDHPIAPLLHSAPDFSTNAGMSDALLHPRERSYTVSELFAYLKRCGFVFGRWLRQAPYLARCGALAASPHAPRLEALAPEAEYAAVELFRGTMTRHSVIAYRDDEPAERFTIDFDGDAWPNYVPVRLREAIAVRDRLPHGVTGVLINRNHTDTDLYLPINMRQERFLAAIDGKHRIADMCASEIDRSYARDFFQRLWQWDQVVFDATAVRRSC